MRTASQPRQSPVRRLLVPLLLSMTLVAFPAMADDDDDDRPGWRQHHGWHDRDRDHYRDRDRDWARDDRRRWERHQRERWHDQRRWEREQARRWDRERRYYRNVYVYPRYRPAYPRTVVHRYVGPPPWARGRDYRSYGYRNVYYVPYDDYRRYGLYDPGYGRRWMRDDAGNFLLIVAATGIIASILGN